MTREELEAKLEAVEARTDAKFERLLADIRTSNAELAGKIDTAAAKALDKWTATGLVAAAVALIFAMIAFGGDQFGAGREIGDSIAKLEAKLDRLGAEKTALPTPPKS